MRPFLVVLHRYVGLVMAGFLLVAGATGSLLAWNDELEAAISPSLFRVAAPPGAVPLDPLVLRERVMARHPEAVAVYVPLGVVPGRAASFYLDARLDTATGKAVELADDQVFVDPYTGAVLGARKSGDIGQGLKNLMPFVYRLHYSLALGVIGTWAFGIVALLWTLDCFVGALLTFPAWKKGRRGWGTRWWPAWQVRRGGGSYYRLNFDLHRAGGLWVWAMLLVFAWSSVAFNLSPVYDPAMRALFSFQPNGDAVAPLAQPQPEPGIGWARALDTGRRWMQAEAHRQGFEVLAEEALRYDPGHATFRYVVKSSRDVRDRYPNTTVSFDANTGAWRGAWLPTGAAAGDTVTSWLASLHMAALWGVPFKAFICAMGLAVATLSVTGLVIWWKKRRARRLSSRSCNAGANGRASRARR